MAEPEVELTDEEKITAAVGEAWKKNPRVVSWDVHDEDGLVVDTMHFQWRESGYKLWDSTGTLAGVDERSKIHFSPGLPSDPTRLVQAIDIASYQERSYPSLYEQLDPEHVVARFYLGQGEEGPSQQITKDMVALAKDQGRSVGGYFWGYMAYDPRDSLQRVLDLASACNVRLPVVWVDVETYSDGSIVNEWWLRELEDEVVKQGIQGGAYSGRDFWKRIGDPSFPGWWLWTANYNGKPDLDVPSYGDMTLVGHQWDDYPCDRDVFLELAT